VGEGIVMQHDTDVLVNAANNVCTAFALQNAAERLGRDPHTYDDVVAKRLDTLISYLRLEA
jgi:hypothetical protein